MYVRFPLLCKTRPSPVLGEVHDGSWTQYGELIPLHPPGKAEQQADLMLSMAACFPTYGAAAVRERGKELWEGIKTEVRFPLLEFDVC